MHYRHWLLDWTKLMQKDQIASKRNFCEKCRCSCDRNIVFLTLNCTSSSCELHVKKSKCLHITTSMSIDGLVHNNNKTIVQCICASQLFIQYIYFENSRNDKRNISEVALLRVCVFTYINIYLVNLQLTNWQLPTVYLSSRGSGAVLPTNATVAN